MHRYFALKYFVAATVLLFSAIHSYTQQAYFKNMFPNEVFPNATSIMQDIKGNMWITAGGELIKYDGYSTTYYKPGKLTSSSLAGPRVECVYADKDGMIWVGMLETGLDRLDPSTGIFTHYRHNIKDSTSISSDFVTVLYEDRSGNFWIGTHGGLNKLDKKTGTFTHYVHKDNDATSLSNNQVRAIYQDREGALWLGTGSTWGGSSEYNEAGVAGEGGLNKMNISSGKFIRYMHNDKDTTTLINNKVRAVFEDKEGNFWVGTAGDGLHLMNRQTGKFQRLTYDPKHPEKLSREPVNKNDPTDHITFITQDIRGEIWIGALGGGLTRYNWQTKKIQHYNKRDSASGFTGMNEGVFGHCISRDGLLWVTSLAGRVYTISPYEVRVPHVKINGSPNSFFRSNDSSLYVGTSTGLYRRNLADGSIKEYPVKEFVYGINADNNNNLWIATFSKGLIRLNLQTQAITKYNHKKGDGNTLVNDSVFSVCIDKQQNIWIGTQNGLDKLNTTTNQFTHYLHNDKDSNSLSSNVVLSLLDDGYGNLWIGHGNSAGLDRMNMTTGKCKRFSISDFIYSIKKVSDGTIWVGGLFGLYRYLKKEDNLEVVTDPLTNTTFASVWAIEEDDRKNLWLSTAAGIIKYNLSKTQTTIYNKNEGVDATSLNLLAGYKDPDGHLYFADTSGYYIFLPKELEVTASTPEVVFTNLFLGNREIKKGANSPLKDDISRTTLIDLKYSQAIFSFEFHVIDYNNPEENRCIYKLENYDDDWRVATNPSKAYYFNVPPGKYIFHVKARNSLGVWAEKSINVTITPPWWKTWWAYTFFVIGIVLVIWAIIAYRSKKLKKENRLLEERVARRTAQLNQSLENLKAAQTQLVQSEKMASLGELTAGIAHEIQNPLNFVKNFSEVNKELVGELREEKNNPGARNEILDTLENNLEKIILHGKRADAIVKGMLQHSRNNSGQKEPTDINALADEYLRLSYHGLRAKDKTFNATMKTNFDESIGKINIIPQDIGRVLLNLYNNAFYSVAEKSISTSLVLPDNEPTVWLSTKKLNDKIEIRVRDNGMGIPQRALDKIFQPFFTTKPTGQGTGLGLSLAYDIIKAHGGELKVETKEGEWAEFIILLPNQNPL